MIVPIIGNVTYSITLDPTIWIFDDRKVDFDKAFEVKPDDTNEEDELEKAANRWNRAVYEPHSKPPVNRSISRLEDEKILQGTFVMPIEDFITHSEIKSDAINASLIVADGEDVTISLGELRNSYLLFARDGKPLTEDGPVHFYHKDGSNRDTPVKFVKKIKVN